MEHSKCVQDLLEAFYHHNRTFLSSYWDATGKPGAGVLRGNLVALGDYDQCVALDDAKYCLVDASLALPQDQGSALLRWGLCAVPSCNETSIAHNIQHILNESLHITWLNVTEAEVHCAAPAHLTPGFYVVLAILAALVLVVIAGTVADYLTLHRHSHPPRLIHSLDSRGPQLIGPNDSSPPDGSLEEEAEPGSIQDSLTRGESRHLRELLRYRPGRMTEMLLCFSLRRNAHALIETRDSPHAIPCLHGLRVLSMAWIVLGHTFLATYSTGAVVNPGSVREYSESLLWQPVGNAYLAVDTFFFLSGLLVVYLGLRAMETRSGKLPLLSFYLHRYLRLTPSVAALMLFWVYVKPHLGSGPLWYNIQTDPMCARYWWTNLLYVQNFYPTSMQQQCVGWTWYLALDMQFYLVSPLLMFTLYRSRRAGLWLLGTLTAMVTVTTAVLIAVYDIDVNLTGSVINNDNNSVMAFEDIIYSKPYCRAGAYLVGMATGCMLNSQLRSGEQHYLTKWRASLGWLATITLLAVTVWSFYPAYHGHPFNTAANALYGSLSHVVWPLLLGALVYLCWHGYGGWMNTVLSCRGFVPLSRLTFGVYLWHPVLQFVCFHSIRAPLHVSNPFIVAVWSAVLLWACVIAALVTLLVEMPVRNLESLFRGKSHS